MEERRRSYRQSRGVRRAPGVGTPCRPGSWGCANRWHPSPARTASRVLSATARRMGNTHIGGREGVEDSLIGEVRYLHRSIRVCSELGRVRIGRHRHEDVYVLGSRASLELGSRLHSHSKCESRALRRMLSAFGGQMVDTLMRYSTRECWCTFTIASTHMSGFICAADKGHWWLGRRTAARTS
jgi:hypothetical protein